MPASSIVRLIDAAEINPGLSEDLLRKPEPEVCFVPMSAVSETTANVAAPEVRRASDCFKGYTPFRRNDVLVAKITPCF